MISTVTSFRETAFRLSVYDPHTLDRGRRCVFTCAGVYVYVCMSRACMSNANNHGSPSQLYGKLIPLDAVSADEERKANTV